MPGHECFMLVCTCISAPQPIIATVSLHFFLCSTHRAGVAGARSASEWVRARKRGQTAAGAARLRLSAPPSPTALERERRGGMGVTGGALLDRRLVCTPSLALASPLHHPTVFFARVRITLYKSTVYIIYPRLYLLHNSFARCSSALERHTFSLLNYSLLH